MSDMGLTWRSCKQTEKNMTKKHYFLLILLFVLSFSVLLPAQDEEQNEEESLPVIEENQPWSVRIAQSFVNRHPGAVTYDEYMTKEKWNYEQGIMLHGMRMMYETTGNEVYYNFVKGNLDQYVNDEGEIRTYPYDDFNLDKIKPGGALLFVYEKTGIEKYKLAADLLKKQIDNQPRTEAGGFWHKKIYPYQMWLDGLYMAEPFYAEYSVMFDQPGNFEDIAKQFIVAYEKTVDEETGLLYHAWNENKEQEWADKETGHSPHFWGRAIGWYVMAIVDVLDYMPEDAEGRDKMIEILDNVCEAVVEVRDCDTKLWYQVLDMPEKEGNYLEASCATMFTYAFAKGANKGYLDKKFINIAKESFDGIIKYHVNVDKNGYIDLLNTCSAAGLGGDPYRKGDFAYYISEPTRKNDFKGYGPLLFSAIELEKGGVLATP